MAMTKISETMKELQGMADMKGFEGYISEGASNDQPMTPLSSLACEMRDFMEYLAANAVVSCDDEGSIYKIICGAVWSIAFSDAQKALDRASKESES